MRTFLLPDSEWKKRLTTEQYNILRKKGTEKPGSCSLLHTKENGVYSCVACKNKLFISSGKFDSGTGWPSFVEPYASDAIITQEDSSHGMKRTEVLCARCQGHLGHVFSDGPAPTKKRFCINGAVLWFERM